MKFAILRRKQRLTQIELCEKLNVSRATVAMWETGKSVPKTTDLPKLAKVLNVSVEEIINCFTEKQR